MTATLIIIGYLLAGLIFVVIVGRLGAFDYSPKYDEIKPRTAMWLWMFTWPAVILILLGSGIFHGLKWVFSLKPFRRLGDGLEKIAGVKQ